MSQSLLNIPFTDAVGEELTLKSFPSKIYLIVNVASKCGLTPQYEGLQKLFRQYREKGLTVLGFPANEFLAQEPGTNEEIQQFCNLNYQVEFPVLAKMVVKGEGQHPFYSSLTNLKKEAVKNTEGDFEGRLEKGGLLTGEPHDIKWNFEKFLVAENGEVIERYNPDVSPMDERILAKLDSLL